MQLIEFKISSDNIGIETSSKRYFDLHNDFELLNFHYDLKNDILK